MEVADVLHPAPRNAVLFYGSSSIRLWSTLEADFAPLPVVNRGFGGANLFDCVDLFERLVVPCAPRALVVYAGDNDLGNGRSPEQVRESLRELLRRYRAHWPDRPFVYLAIKPSPARAQLHRAIERANWLCCELLRSDPAAGFVDTFHPLLGPHGEYRKELYQPDGLHLSDAGYALWRSALLPESNEFAEKNSPNFLNISPVESPGMNREYHRWHSPALNRHMELLVFGHAGARVLVFPTRVGRFYDYENFGMVDRLKDHLERGWLQLYCLDSVDSDSLYCFWKRPCDRIHYHQQYEKYIIDEVVPFSEKKNPGSFLMTHGCSLGAYHAVNIALRHPELFGRTVAFSGRYDLTQWIADFRPLFDSFYDDSIYYHMPSHYLPNLWDEKLLSALRRMKFTLVIGQEDPFLQNNQHLSEHLRRRGVQNDLHVWEGRAHKYKYWRDMVVRFL